MSHIAIPLRDLLLQDEMIAECIPSQATHLSMVLMSVFSSMGENQIRLNTLLQGLEPTLDLLALLGKKAVPEVHCLDSNASCFG